MKANFLHKVNILWTTEKFGLNILENVILRYSKSVLKHFISKWKGGSAQLSSLFCETMFHKNVDYSRRHKSICV